MYFLSNEYFFSENYIIHMYLFPLSRRFPQTFKNKSLLFPQFPRTSGGLVKNHPPSLSNPQPDTLYRPLAVPFIFGGTRPPKNTALLADIAKIRPQGESKATRPTPLCLFTNHTQHPPHHGNHQIQILRSSNSRQNKFEDVPRRLSFKKKKSVCVFFLCVCYCAFIYFVRGSNSRIKITYKMSQFFDLVS